MSRQLWYFGNPRAGRTKSGRTLLEGTGKAAGGRFIGQDRGGRMPEHRGGTGVVGRPSRDWLRSAAAGLPGTSSLGAGFGTTTAGVTQLCSFPCT